MLFIFPECLILSGFLFIYNCSISYNIIFIISYSNVLTLLTNIKKRMMIILFWLLSHYNPFSKSNFKHIWSSLDLLFTKCCFIWLKGFIWSLIHPPIPKIDHSGKSYITNSKPNTKVNNEKPKHIITTPTKFKPSPIKNKSYPTNH